MKLRKKPNCANWYAEFTVNGSRHSISTGTRNRSQASVIAERLYRTHAETAVNAPLKAWIEHDLDTYLTHGHKPRTFLTDVKPRLLKLAQIFGDIHMSQLAAQPLMDWLLKMDCAAATRINCFSVVKASLTRAVRSGWLAVNPLASYTPRDLPKRPKKLMQYLTPDEEKAFLAVASRHPLYPGILLARLAGLRMTEVRMVNGEDINLSVKPYTVTVRAREGWTPKSHQERAVPLPSDFGKAVKKLKKGPVLRGAAGGRIPERDMRDIRNIYRLAGVKVPRQPWHILRHTYVHRLRASGASWSDIQGFLGHGSVATTIGSYGHFYGPERAAVVEGARLAR